MPQAQVNGVRLVYDLQGSGQPVVLIHGAQGDRSMFWGMVPWLTAAGFQVLSFDQRGSGESEKPAQPYTTALLAEDTAALLDHVGFPSAHVIGVSMGGMIAQELVLRHPQKVRSLVLGCTTPGGPHSVRLEDRALGRAYATEDLSPEERGRALAEAAFTEGYLREHPEVVSAMIEARRQRPLDPQALSRRLEAALAHDTYGRLGEISCPVLVLTGKNDALISWENSRILAERIPGAKLVLLEPAGHVFWLEQPEKSREAILGFLKGLGASS